MSVKARAVQNSTKLPMAIELGVSQATGVAVDNYSNFWLAVGNDLFVPPHTLGWANNFYGSIAGSLAVKKGAPSGITQNVSGDGVIITSLYDTAIVPTPGVQLITATGPQLLSTGLLAIVPGVFSTVLFPTYRTFMRGIFLRVSVVCRTAGGEGRLNIQLFNVTVGNVFPLNQLPVIAAAPSFFAIDDFDLAAMFQTTGFTPAQVGHSVALSLNVLDIVGVNTYDIFVSYHLLIGT